MYYVTSFENDRNTTFKFNYSIKMNPKTYRADKEYVIDKMDQIRYRDKDVS